jgi:hypothetical protein
MIILCVRRERERERERENQGVHNMGSKSCNLEPK